MLLVPEHSYLTFGVNAGIISIVRIDFADRGRKRHGWNLVGLNKNKLFLRRMKSQGVLRLHAPPRDPPESSQLVMC